jgi:assimilatory nitrate reductase catalytic subunit
LTAGERLALLASRPSAPDAGPSVCACFGVGRHSIESAIAEGAGDLQSIGSRLKAGTNCGSCLPELRRIIAEAIATQP